MKASLAIEAVRGSHHLDAPQHGRPIACLSLLLVLLATSCIPRLPLDDRCGVQSDCYEGELCLLPAGRCVPLAALTDGGGGLDSGRGEEDGGAGGEAGGPTPDAADAEVPDAGDAARPDGGPEQCDGLDDDGDGVVDEGCPCAPAGAAARPCGPPERGRCRPGEQRCLDEGVWGGCAEAVWPTAETCNGLDDDCDDLVDEELDPRQERASPCLDRGVCAGSSPICAGAAGWECRYEARFEAWAERSCDRLDNDCDGRVDEELGLGGTCQGIGGPGSPCGLGQLECARDGSAAVTCSTHPGGSAYRGSAERCNGRDDDCDGMVDEELQDEPPDLCPRDGVCRDGSVVCDGAQGWRCAVPPGHEPDGETLCDGLDNDCDGLADEQLVPPPGICLALGICAETVPVCHGASGWVCGYPPAFRPSGEELCDGLDEDCDGSADDDFAVSQPCPAPGGPGSPCGPGVWECELLGDGRVCSTAPGGSEYSGLPEACNGRDDDCDGQVDEDFPLGRACPASGGPGSPCGPGVLECNLATGDLLCSTTIGGSRYPGRAESCNGKDDDCDGQVDEDLQLGQPCPASGGPGSPCVAGTWVCQQATGQRICSTQPGGPEDRSQPERCDGADNDCDGQVDEDFALGTGCPASGAPGSPCPAGVWECQPVSGERICSTALGGSAYRGLPESCNRRDDDCDGQVDEGFALGTGCPGTGGAGSPCIGGLWECNFLSGERICSTHPGGSAYMGTPERCNGRDDDCDGVVDEDLGVTTCGQGQCRHDQPNCLGGQVRACDPREGAIPEILGNGLDDDCDGMTDDDPCLPREEQYWEGNGHCYRLAPATMAGDARSFCQSKGGTLACIGSAEENAMLGRMFAQETLWIGLSSNQQQPDVFNWDCGERLDYTTWEDGEPAPALVARCVLINRTQPERWASEPCSRVWPGICERVPR